MTVSILLDLLVAGLLGTTIYFCVQLNRRLNGLRGGQDELRQLIETLSDATRRAQAAITELKMSSDAVASRLGTQVTGARSLADELTLIIEAGNNLADRVSGRLTGMGGKVTPIADGAAQPAGRSAPLPRPTVTRSDAAAPLATASNTPSAQRPADATPPDLLRALREVR